MLDADKTLPKNPDELRQFTALLLAEVKSQAVLIHCPAGLYEAMSRDPHAYLAGTLTAIVAGHKQSKIKDLLPWNYKK